MLSRIECIGFLKPEPDLEVTMISAKSNHHLLSERVNYNLR